ncbi:MAG TPA: DNA-processing protein DprA [Candidatus Eisenbacteria bacterium]|nr:DNA-processing protein DprA [Candidatus Eisenbacteria bacterium]
MVKTELAASPAQRETETSLQWLALSLTPGVGAGRGRKLVELFDGIDRVFHASLTELEAAGLPAASAQSIALGRSLELAGEELDRVKAMGAKVVALDDPSFPKRLYEIYDPPLVLYLAGCPEIINQYGVAVVGTRHPTPYGVGVAERLACDLAARGLVIISGMARGIDTAAHRGALNARGRTVAVWGTGLDVTYPKENQKIADQILNTGGAILSEFPLGTFPAPQNFPIRNRIISGMSIGVLVIEAGEYSGTRVTARCALEQGRDVYAVPGNVTNKLSWGPNTLIKQGAALVATWEDVWEALPTDVRLALTPPDSAASQAPESASLFSGPDMGPEEKRVFAALRADESTHIDELVERLVSHLSSSQIFAALFELELSGKIRALPGKYYVRVI